MVGVIPPGLLDHIFGTPVATSLKRVVSAHPVSPERTRDLSPPGLTADPTRLLHRFPRLDGVMPEHPSGHSTTRASKRACLYFNPLGMGRRHCIPETADQTLLSVQQPALTILLRVTLYEWLVLLWHRLRLTIYKSCKPLHLSLMSEKTLICDA